MAKFEVRVCGPHDLNEPSTSYLHLSGYSKAGYYESEQRRQQQRLMEEADGEVGGLDGEDEVMGEESMEISRQNLATTGQAIASATTFMRGHGAYLASFGSSEQEDSVKGAAPPPQSPMIHSSLCGLIQKTNKLISVTALKRRYNPEVGDLVIGRVTDLQPGNKRWKVDIQSRQDSNLLLSSINLPGGIQRRKLDSDELEMRGFFKEGDLVVAEIQSIFTDGSTNLHTRSLNYGKLRNGQLIIVNSSQIQRLKSHFIRLDSIGLEIVIGLNGVIWVSLLNQGKVNVTTGTGRDIEAVYSDVNETIEEEVRLRISRMLDIIALFSCHHLPITDVVLVRAYEVSVQVAPLPDPGMLLDEEHPDPSLTSDVMKIILDESQKIRSE